VLAANGTRVTTMLKANCWLPRLQISGQAKLHHQHRKVSGENAMEADTHVVQLNDSVDTENKMTDSMGEMLTRQLLGTFH